MPLGFRILSVPRRVDAGLAARFAALPVANVSDSMARLPAAGPRLRPMHAGGTMAGPAFTVKARPGDNLLVHKALDLAEPGDVLVVDAGGDLTNAIIGEIMSSYAAMRRLGGMVIYGAIRDADALRAASFPVFAAGVTHRGPYKDGPGEINVPIALEGMVVEPGDLMLGDGDGVLCVPFDHAETVCREAEAKQAAETRMLDDIRAGRPADRSWVDAALHRAGYAPGA